MELGIQLKSLMKRLCLVFTYRASSHSVVRSCN